MTSIKIEDELMDGIENFIHDRDEPPRGKMSHDDAVNVMVRDWLMSQGYLALPDESPKIALALDAARVPKA